MHIRFSTNITKVVVSLVVFVKLVDFHRNYVWGKDLPGGKVGAFHGN